MKLHRWLTTASLWLLVAVCADAANLRAVLIEANNSSGTTDHRLEKVESKLRRVFGFQSYTYVDEKTATITAGDNVDINLKGRNTINVQSKGSEDALSARVNWTRKNKSVISTNVKLRKGSPVVLGGVNYGNGKLIVVLSSE